MSMLERIAASMATSK